MIHAKRMRRWSLTAAATLLALAGWSRAAAAQTPGTRAERSAWQETSRYQDVLTFIDRVDSRDRHDVLHPTTFGYSLEGRALPLVVVGRDLPDGGPEAVRRAGGVRVLVLANIHGGEVEGKEAAQMLLRDLAGGEHREWLDSLVVLVAPIYNADGNERVSVLNRHRQNGPLGGVGERANAQGLDLNRDHTKLASPEARSLVRLLNHYDPHVVVDLHTTNGTFHGYHLTYSPPLHPDTDPGIVGLLRDHWLPAASAAMEERGWHTYHYGNAYAPEGGERGWYTFDYRPRFNNNYVGLRNRVAILSEAFAYVSFEDRVRATLAFVETLLDYAHRNAGRVAAAVAAADGRDLRGSRRPLRAEFERGDTVAIRMGAVDTRLSPYSGRDYRVRLDSVRMERMPDFGAFSAAEAATVPAAYYVPPGLEAVIDLLTLHGVELSAADAPVGRLERFVIDSTRVAERAFQGHHEREVFGRWVTEQGPLPPGTLEVPMNQSLARLVYHLLEPRAPDGVVNWSRLAEALERQPGQYPILRRPVAR